MHEAVLCIESTVKGRGTEREKNKQARKEGHRVEREGERGGTLLSFFIIYSD